MTGPARPQFEFSINWKLSLASVLLFPLLIVLGFWQLNRADEKQTILEQWYKQQALPAKTVDSLEQLVDEPFQAIAIDGILDKTRYWLLEGKFYKGILGYQVLMVLHTEANEYLLVNRGWVQSSVYREELPQIVVPDGKVQLRGMLVIPSDFKLIDESESRVGEWPIRILEANTIAMSKQYGQELYSKVLRLEEQSVAAYQVDWQAVNILPAKHKAYAFQWFSMACALFILWFCANSNIIQLFRKNSTKS